MIYHKLELTKEQNTQLQYLLDALYQPGGRPALTYIQILDDGTAVATDGFRLHSVLLDHGFIKPLFELDGDLYQEFADGRNYILCRPVNGRLRKSDKSVVMEIHDHEDEKLAYPDWRSVVGISGRAVAGMGINAKYLKSALSNLPIDNAHVIVCNDCLIVTSNDNDSARAYGVIMGMRSGNIADWSPRSKVLGARHSLTDLVEQVLDQEFLEEVFGEL